MIEYATLSTMPVSHQTNGTFTNGVVKEYDVIIVGAGFSGISTLHRLRKQRLRAHIFESGKSSQKYRQLALPLLTLLGDELGGVWNWNR